MAVATLPRPCASGSGPVRSGFDPELARRIQDILVKITPEQAKEFMPEHCTGFVSASDASYKLIKDAAVSLGKLKGQS